jgi:sugar O-acyltransferase (sialic acid O-acetyltransferase NeuD family)
VLDLVEDLPQFRVDGFVENMDRSRTEEPIEGLPVRWIDELDDLAESHLGLCVLGTTKRARLVEEAAGRGLRFATVVHPTARVSRRSTLGEGTFVSAGAIVAARTTVGSHVIVNRGALIGHDVTIGDFVTVGPGACVSGLCRIEDGAYIAVGAVIVDRVSIGAGSVVGAGAVVTRDVPPHVQVVGVPARVVKEGVDGR